MTGGKEPLLDERARGAGGDEPFIGGEVVLVTFFSLPDSLAARFALSPGDSGADGADASGSGDLTVAASSDGDEGAVAGARLMTDTADEMRGQPSSDHCRKDKWCTYDTRT